MRRLTEVLSNIVIILIVGLAGSAVGYYSAGYAPGRDAALGAARETIGAPAKQETARLEAPKQEAAKPEASTQPAKPVQKEAAPPPFPPQMSAITFSPQLASIGLVPPAPPAAVAPAMSPVALAHGQRNPADDRADAERHKAKVRSRYSSCVHAAERAFAQDWDATCKISQEARRKQYQHCIGALGQSKATCSKTYAAIPEKNCKLPAKVTNGLGSKLQKTARRCVLERQAGLE
jgi:hypothetical protein